MIVADTVRIDVDGPLDLVRTCRPLSAGSGDPTWRFDGGRVVRAAHTPDGPGTVEVCGDGDAVRARAWGPGAGHLLSHVHRLVGAHDHTDGFDADLHPVVRMQHARRPGERFAAGGSVWDAVIHTTLGQRVTTQEARRSWWQLAQRHGADAPGPHGLRLGPTARVASRLGDHDWHVLGVERKRADAVRRMASVLPALERAAAAGSAEFQRVLMTLPGVGPWTATGLTINVLGDPDCVILGDLHVPHTVCHALAGHDRGSDERMLELLAPWPGHRGRVVRLVSGAGLGAPRRGPRYTPIPIARW